MKDGTSFDSFTDMHAEKLSGEFCNFDLTLQSYLVIQALELQ